MDDCTDGAERDVIGLQVVTVGQKASEVARECIRGLGSPAHPGTFGHGGVGSSYCWADPASGVSFAYVTNYVAPDPWHSARLDRVSNIVHAAIG